MQQSKNEQRRTEIGEVVKEDSEDFNVSGPTYLKNIVDWGNQDHTRSIMACLARGAYVLERDRQEKRTGDEALGPPWWKSFQFQCNKTFIDHIDHSIFGAIFEYKPQPHAPYQQQGVPPGKYIIVFRGTCLEPETKERDKYLDFQIILDCLTQDPFRYQVALEEINVMLSKIDVVDPKDVVLVGHSLGAAIALQAGKEKARKGCLLKGYFFNPSFRKFWIDSTTGEFKSEIIVDLSLSKNMANKDDSDDDSSFQSLCSWIPSLLADPNDLVSKGYIHYFENRDKMKESRSKKVDMDHIGSENLSTMEMTIVANSSGRESEPSYLIPSALLTKNMDPSKDPGEAHAIWRWWKEHSNCQSKLYKY